MRDIEKLGEAPVRRLLLSNCIHSSAALLVYSIYNITDTLIVSWGVNETAEGAMRFALKIWFVPVTVNLALDSIFVFIFHLGIRGAALATVISQMVSACMYIWFFFIRRDRTYKVGRRSFQIDPKMIKEIVWLGMPSLVSQFSSSVIIVLINRYLGAFHGEQAITSMGFAMKIQTFLIMPQSGMLQGMQPILGYNDSNGRTKRVKETIEKAVIMSFIYGLFLSGVSICFGDKLLAVFTSNEAMVELGRVCLIFITVTAALKSYCPLITTFYQAIGNARNAMTIIAGSVIMKILVIIIMANAWKTAGILWSFIAVDILTFLFTAVFRIFNAKRKDTLI